MGLRLAVNVSDQAAGAVKLRRADVQTLMLTREAVDSAGALLRTVKVRPVTPPERQKTTVCCA